MRSFTKEKVAKGEKNLWFLRRLRQHTTNQATLKKTYESYIRSALEYALPSVTSMLTQGQVDSIERIQKKATKLILGSPWFKSYEGYLNYETRLRLLNMETISARMQKQLLKFSLKIEKDPRYSSYFTLNHSVHHMSTRRQQKYVLPIAKTERQKNSPMYAVVRTLNQHYQTQSGG